jgi:hypothetical protein
MSVSKLPKVSWPPPTVQPTGSEVELAKLRYQAELDEVNARWRDEVTAEIEEDKRTADREDSWTAAEDKLREAVHAAYLEVAKGSLERSLSRANFVTAAAGAIATAYTGLLGLVYSGSGARALPGHGVWPAVFLGLAFVLSAFYVAYQRPGWRAGSFLPRGTGTQLEEERLALFVEWVGRRTNRNAWAIRTAVVSLGIGVALTPLVFLSLTEGQRLLVVYGSFGLLALYLVYEIIAAIVRRRQTDNGSLSTGIQVPLAR